LIEVIMAKSSLALRLLSSTLSLAIWCCGVGYAQDLKGIKLRVAHVNDFKTGFDHGKNTYTDAFIKGFITEAVSRPVKANVCKSLPLRKIRMTAVQDGKRCQTRSERVASGAVAFVWTLTGKHPILNKTMDIKTVRKDFKQISTLAGDGCKPLAPPSDLYVPTQACEVLFDAPISTGLTANDFGTQYSIRFDAVNSKGKVIQTRTKEFAIPNKVPLIVSVGESLAAGQGNPDISGKSEDNNYDLLGRRRDCEDDTSAMIKLDIKPKMKKKPVWFYADDYRSLRSGPAIAAQSLLSTWPYINFITLAKSGAKISSNDQDRDIIDQLEIIRGLLGKNKIDVLLVSAGGNDVGFGDGLRTMAADFLNNGAERVLSKFIDSIPKLRNEGYPAINKKIKELNVGAVIINEYPGALFHNRAGNPERGCGVFSTLKFWRVSKRDAVAVTRMGVLLNEEVKLAADHFGWRLVGGLATSYDKHGYCTGNQSYYVSATNSCDTQGDFEGMMHPNELGTAIYAKALERELRRAIPSPGVPPVK
jgi:hypothetical protein